MSLEIQIDQVVDTKGELCPMPVIKARLAMDKLASGQVIKVIATDPGSKTDIPSWARTSGNKLLEAGEDNGTFVFLVEKAQK